MFRHWLIAGLLVGCGLTATWAADTKAELPPAPPAKGAAHSQDDTPKPATPGAGNTATTDPEKSVPATEEQLKQWIQDLVNPKFAVRQAASQKLVQSGKAGMEAVAGAAQTDDLELATRCLAVLTEGLSSKTTEVQQAARTALQNLAKSDNKSVAQRARTALEPPAKVALGGGRVPGAFQGGFPGNFQQIAVQFDKAGVRNIKVIENGKETVIKDNNGKDISVTTTETVNGQKVTKTVTGKDVEDLKKNNAEAHELFEKYTKGGNGIRINVGMNGIGNGIIVGQPGVQGLVRRPRMINSIKATEAFGEIDKVRQKLEESNERLSKAAESGKPDPADLKAISAEIKALTKRLTEIKTELGLP